MDFPTAENLASRPQLFEDVEAEAVAASTKPKYWPRRLPHAVSDDGRLSLAGYFLLAYRARRSAKWSMRPEQLKQEYGFGEDLFYAAVGELRKLGYLRRKQQRNRGKWGYAVEKVCLDAAPENARRGYLHVTEEDIAGLTWKQAAILTYLRSHAPGFILSAARIGKRFALHPQTVQTILRPLVDRKLVMLVKGRNERGRFGRGGYTVSPHTKLPETVSPDTVKPGTYQRITPTPPSRNKLSPQVPPLASPEESITPPMES